MGNEAYVLCDTDIVSDRDQVRLASEVGKLGDITAVADPAALLS